MEAEIIDFIEIVICIVIFCIGYGVGRSDRDLEKVKPETLERLWNKDKKRG